MALEIRSRGTAAQQAIYAATIRPILTTIRATLTGRNVITRIEQSPRRVRIVPFGQRDVAEFGFNNAVAYSGNLAASGTVGGQGRARGTGSEIHFSVANLRNRGIQGRNDEVLLHELCHSLRHINGVQRLRRRAGGRLGLLTMTGGFENVEEFFAAMVTSVYSSELNRPALGNHNSSGIRNPNVLRQPPFSTRLADFRRRMPDFVQQMATIPADRAVFNPFRDHIH